MDFSPFKHYGAFWNFAHSMTIRINIQKQFTERARKAADDCKNGDYLTWCDAFSRLHQEESLLETLEGVWHEFLEALKDTEREALLKELEELFAAREEFLKTLKDTEGDALEEFPETRKVG